jgi:peptidoglycan/LPS O-acetylase OafA/YrhL
MSSAAMLDRLRARRDAWTLFAWLCVGAALVLTAMPGDLAAVHALRTLVGVVALFAVAGSIVLAVGVMRRRRQPRDSLVALAALVAGVLVFVTLL